ncbi:MAG TPA: MFS transporter [Stellaceae bacterium]|jgi:MFS family permease|nr:MFS transporter [Stellaceae bacterium]
MTPSERRWSLAAAISSIAVFGIGIGISQPLLALMLETRGTDSSLNGLNAGAGFLGVLIGPLLMPRLVARFGFKNFLLTMLPLSLVLFLLLKPFDSLGAWFVLRLLSGISGSSTFAATEAWISQLAGDTGRGRVMGIYTASLSAGFAIGPALLSVTGIAGWPPFIACAIIEIVAMLPLLAVRGGAQKVDHAGSHPLAMMARMKPLVLIVILFAMYEAATVSLLPVWGARAGLSVAAAASLVSAVFVGAILLQIPIGYLSDLVGRTTTMRVCAALGIVGAALLPLLVGYTPALFVVLVIWGGFTTGLYPVALAIIGDRFRGADLLNANAGLVIAYGTGALIGPILGGGGMDAWNPHGLIAILAAMFVVLLLSTWWRADKAPRTPASSTQTAQ